MVGMLSGTPWMLSLAEAHALEEDGGLGLTAVVKDPDKLLPGAVDPGVVVPARPPSRKVTSGPRHQRLAGTPRTVHTGGERPSDWPCITFCRYVVPVLCRPMCKKSRFGSAFIRAVLPHGAPTLGAVAGAGAFEPASFATQKDGHHLGHKSVAMPQLHHLDLHRVRAAPPTTSAVIEFRQVLDPAPTPDHHDVADVSVNWASASTAASNNSASVASSGARTPGSLRGRRSSRSPMTRYPRERTVSIIASDFFSTHVSSDSGNPAFCCEAGRANMGTSEPLMARLRCASLRRPPNRSLTCLSTSMPATPTISFSAPGFSVSNPGSKPTTDAVRRSSSEDPTRRRDGDEMQPLQACGCRPRVADSHKILATPEPEARLLRRSVGILDRIGVLAPGPCSLALDLLLPERDEHPPEITRGDDDPDVRTFERSDGTSRLAK